MLDIAERGNHTEKAFVNRLISYRTYLVTVLAVIYACDSGDRYVLGILLQSIKVDLHLSDTQLGLLTGIAFAVFYSLLGIPIARWADRGNRVIVVTITTALWSAAIALCAFAANFTQLLVMRAFAGIGEAGCVPAAQSLIGSHFDRAERARATSFYLLGGVLGACVGMYLGGLLNEWFGWRKTFLYLGVPGLVVAAVAGVTLRDSRGQVLAERPGGPSVSQSLREIRKSLWENRTFRHVLLFFSIVAFFNCGIVQWIPAFFVRSYGIKTEQVGAWLAITYGSAGILGTWLGGDLASRFARNNESLQLRVIAAWTAGYGAISVCIYLSHNFYVALGLLGLGTVGWNAANGPLFATIQTLVPQQLRALSVAILFTFFNLIGVGLGPLAIGALSDAFHPATAQESLRWALVALSPGYCLSSWYLYRASRTVSLDIEAGLKIAT